MRKFRELYSAEFEEDDPMLTFWDRIATEHALDPPTRLGKDARGTGSSELGEHSLVLLNWHAGLFKASLDRLLSTEATVFAHLPPGRSLDPDRLLESVCARLPDCCTPACSTDPAKRIDQTPSVGDRMKRII